MDRNTYYRAADVAAESLGRLILAGLVGGLVGVAALIAWWSL